MHLLRPFLLLLLFGAATLHAQKVLYVEHRGKMHLVRAASGLRPGIDENGKRSYVVGQRYALTDAPEFLPAFISVRKLQVRTRYLEVVNTGSAINHDFEFRATFESAFPLDDVFLVLDLALEKGDHSIFLHEIGQIDPHKPKPITLVVPLNGPLGEGHYQLHLFAGGLEVFHSEQPFAYREAVMDKMIAKRVAGVQDAPPQPFVGPVPEYPPKLVKAKTKGRALVRLHIRPTGAVIDPELVEASDPAFGEAALTAFRQWRFLPRMKAGHAVATVANMPISFEPPSEPAKKP